MFINLNRLLIVIFLILLISCKDSKNSNECIINFFHAGEVIGPSGDPISNVEVFRVDTFGDEVKWAETDGSGNYSFFGGSYSTYGNTYLSFRKNSFKTFNSLPIGKGDGTCGDQTVTINATMELE